VTLTLKKFAAALTLTGTTPAQAAGPTKGSAVNNYIVISNDVDIERGSCTYTITDPRRSIFPTGEATFPVPCTKDILQHVPEERKKAYIERYGAPRN
jgi:hypothetical protein